MKQFIILIFFINATFIYSQIKQDYRYEVPYKNSEENYIVSTNQEYGLVIFRESEKRVPRKEVWEVKVLDNTLEKKHDLSIEVDSKYNILGYESRKGKFYMLFKNVITSKSDFVLIDLDINAGLYTQYQFANDMVIDASHLIITDNQVVLGGYISLRPTFVIYNYINDKIQVVPGFYSKKSIIIDFNYDEIHDSYNVLMGQKNALNRNELSIKSFNSKGKSLVDYKYALENNWRVLNGKMLISEKEKIVIAGSYAPNNSYYSLGYFFATLQPAKELDIEYHNFTTIDHFFDYMRPKRAARIKRKIEESKENNTPYEFKTQLYISSMHEENGQFIITSELYKPEFKESRGHAVYGYNDMSRQSYRDRTTQKYINRTSKLANTGGASHISYHQSVFVVISDKGKKMRDSSIPLVDVETLSLEQVAHVSLRNNKELMFYKRENTLHLREALPDTLIDHSVTISAFDDELELSKHGEEQGKIQQWYDDQYIVWGYQKTNRKQSNKKYEKKSVFFINKFHLE